MPKQLKDAATAAFRDNTKLKEMSPEEREIASQGYEQVAGKMSGTEAELARLYNLERAKFLRGGKSVGLLRGRGILPMRLAIQHPPTQGSWETKADV